MDGVDAAIIETDGYQVATLGDTAFIAYSPGFRDAIKTLLVARPEEIPGYDHIVGELTALHADAVEELLGKAGLERSEIDVIGFHGQTVFHDPAQGITRQLGNGQSLSDRTGIAVVADFRSADVQAGGQGAPFAPLYHAALAHGLERPLAILNIGGVANVTWLGRQDELDILAFDTGPGNALLDDWIRKHELGEYDEEGRISSSGTLSEEALAVMLTHSYFRQTPPKSLDRNDFSPDPVSSLSPLDGAATLAAFTARSVAQALDHFSEVPRRWLVCGGGRKNPTIMRLLSDTLQVPVEPVESVGWSGDHLEAQAFGFLAVRSLLGLPLSVPGTTGVASPMPGGRLFRPAQQN